MHLSRASTYAIKAAAFLVEAGSARVSVREVAAECGLPEQHLAKVMKQLAKAELLSSMRGPTGGFALARDPSTITLLDLVEAVDGPMQPETHLAGPPSVRRATELIAQALQAHRRALAGVTLAEVRALARAREA